MGWEGPAFPLTQHGRASPGAWRLRSRDTAQETVIVTQRPASPSADASFSSHPGAPPLGAHNPLLIRVYRVLRLKMDSSH